MPTIVKNKKKNNSKPKHGKSKDINKIYANKKWVELREAYRAEHPLCEICLEKGIIKPTEEVHHITPISTGKDYYSMCDLAYNPLNLKALCKDCHHNIHKKMP